jgi:protein-tyrosine phosphatase
MNGSSALGGINADWLTASLAVGGCFPIEAAALLAREHRISHVVDLRAEARDEEAELARFGIRLLHLPTDDTCAVAQEMLDQGVAWVRAAHRGGARVLVHCQHGIGRSALLAMCVMVDAGTPPIEAMSIAKRSRAIVSPSPAQLEAFIEYTRRRRATRHDTSVPTFDALAAIAYSHLASPGTRVR